MCEIISSHKHSFTDDLQSITYYIIYTLTRIENVLIYVAHANMHCGWTIYYFIKTREKKITSTIFILQAGEPDW